MNHVESVAEAYKNACIGFKEPEAYNTLFDQYYSDTVLFKDPVSMGSGRQALLKYCDLVSKLANTLTIDKWETICQNDAIAMHWEIKLKPKFWFFTISIPGMTLLRFNEEGKCVEHIEYWDLFNALMHLIPITPVILKLAPQGLRNHLAFLC